MIVDDSSNSRMGTKKLRHFFCLQLQLHVPIFPLLQAVGKVVIDRVCVSFWLYTLVEGEAIL